MAADYRGPSRLARLIWPPTDVAAAWGLAAEAMQRWLAVLGGMDTLYGMMRCLRRILLVAVMAGVGASRSVAQTNRAMVVSADRPETCVQRLQVLVDDVTRLEATITNDNARMDCVKDRLNKLKGLLELAHASVSRLQAIKRSGDDNDDEVDAEKGKILAVLSRAETVAVQAADCSSTRRTRPKKQKRELVVAADLPDPSNELVPAVPLPLPAARGSGRLEQNCVLQGDAALMLAEAMELFVDVRNSAVACSELARGGVEPPGGWQGQKCMTLDDFYVVIARALRLETNAVPDAVRCGQALRTAGLPVDRLLPPQMEGRTTPLYESEVRAFLITGRVAGAGR